MRQGRSVWLGVLALVFLACAPAATPTPVATPTATPRVSEVATRTPVASPVPGVTAAPTPKPTATAPASTAPVRGGLARVSQRSDPVTWDPAKTTTAPTIFTASLVFTKLFTLWAEPPELCKAQLTPVLVKQWRWVDDVTAEFTLKEGVRFQGKPPVNGRELVAQDVAFSLEKWRVHTNKGGQLAALLPIEVVDKYTFRVKASKPWGSIPLEVMGHDFGLLVFAEESGGPKQELWEVPGKSWIGAGAFAFEEWTPGVKWSVVRNPGYFNAGKPFVDRVEVLVMPDLSTRMGALRAGKLTFETELGPLQIEELKRAIPGLQVLACPSVLTYSGSLEMNNSGPPFNNVAVRRAVSMAIDRKAIIEGIHRGRAIDVAVLRSGMPYAIAPRDFPSEMRQYLEYRPEEARKLLSEAGYAKGFDTVVNVTPQFAVHSYMQVAESVVSMLRAVGINASLKTLDYGRFTATILQAKYPVGEMALAPSLLITPEDGHALRSPTKYGGSANRSIVTDPEYDRLYDEFVASRDDAKRQQIARQLQLRYVDQSYRLLLPFVEDFIVAQPNVRGLVWRGANPAGWGLGVVENLWLAP